ncbi:MAG TPA: inorganic phosphate transporter [Phenylobacterium sp.]|uniref:inorganic phosphate transporter n=1 Tax=Phenylobacterium sp. TaxID=1871053 RepID=UPI002D41A9CA|nr:inorganic phosphate transporter [Phenylobacterium sp.]HZZ68864.1 inorganic phosphate transporter [Phenylobacterium sp.]
MSDVAIGLNSPGTGEAAPKLNEKPNRLGVAGFLLVLLAGLGYAGWSVLRDTSAVGEPMAIGVFALLGLALLIALGFEFVNGFHDTANAVATVIYTHSLPPLFAVVWSGTFNFLGVMWSSGAVAYSIITLLPVELILQVGSTAGYAMIFSLLIAAILWNLGTWAMGIPNSSSHALVGSIMGVGLANQLMAASGQATSGVDWSQAVKVGQALLFSPLVGFAASALLLLAMKALIKNRTLYEAPKSDAPPPWWIRGLLILTCTSVSFAHGGNDGQKGMGLIMLILIGAAPTAYALNRTMPDGSAPAFIATAHKAQAAFAAHAAGGPVLPLPAARTRIGDALKSKKVDDPAVYGALAVVSADIEQQVRDYGAIRRVPAAETPNLRNDMYLTGDALRVLTKAKASKFSADETTTVKAFQKGLESGTRFIPTWVKISVAIALGLGTMVGWKRIVVTVGERIGKEHLTYAQGASAEMIAAVTIGAAELYGLPVSTTHILSSGVAGTMAANGSGLQWSTVRSIAMAWVFTLPAAMLIAGSLYFVLRHLI